MKEAVDPLLRYWVGNPIHTHTHTVCVCGLGGRLGRYHYFHTVIPVCVEWVVGLGGIIIFIPSYLSDVTYTVYGICMYMYVPYTVYYQRAGGQEQSPRFRFLARAVT